jgi:hypothetical protein
MRNTLASLAVVFTGCLAAPSDEIADPADMAKEEGGLSFTINPFTVVIDSISPATQIEGRPITIQFHQSNHFTAARTGWVAVELLPSGEQPIENAGSQWQMVALAGGQTAQGVVTVTAPAASHDSFVKLFYFETWNAGEFPTPGPHLAETAPAPLSVAARYSIDVSEMIIGSTRQLAQADHVHATLAYDNPVRVSTGNVDLGFLNHGTYYLSLTPEARVDLVPFVSPALQYDYTFSEFVNGNWYCAGIVAQDTLTFPSADIATLTAGGPHVEARRYRFNSPAGCNTGDYIIVSNVRRHASNDDTPTVVPAAVQIAPGGTVQFTASHFSGPVSWSVSGGALHGTIDASGFFHATQPLDPHAFVTITAVDGQQNTASAALSITR